MMLNTYFVKDNNYKRKNTINQQYMISEFIEDDIHPGDLSILHILKVSVCLIIFYAIIFHLANIILF